MWPPNIKHRKADSNTSQSLCCHAALPALTATPPTHSQMSFHNQAVRNLDDMETMSIPLKYRKIMTFYKYYSGEKVAPIPTIFSEPLHT
jgi:hypothetical protein